jgi:catechol 2,3-dioxygenase
VDEQGNFRMDSLPLDLPGIMSELSGSSPAWQGIHPDTIMGHVHLRVAELDRTRRFYRDVLGFELMAAMPSALFISAGGYHHHLGMNTWAGVGVPPPPPDAAALVSYEIVLPDAEALAAVVKRAQEAAIDIVQQDNGWFVRDPSHNGIILRTAE